jgi:hypothetical protein
MTSWTVVMALTGARSRTLDFFLLCSFLRTLLLRLLVTVGTVSRLAVAVTAGLVCVRTTWTGFLLIPPMIEGVIPSGRIISRRLVLEFFPDGGLYATYRVRQFAILGNPHLGEAALAGRGGYCQPCWKAQGLEKHRLHKVVRCRVDDSFLSAQGRARRVQDVITQHRVLHPAMVEHAEQG